MNRTGRILVIALATSVMVSTSGCANRGANVVAMGLGLAVAGTGVALYASEERTSSSDREPNAPGLELTSAIGAGFMVLGLVVIAGAGIGLMRSSPDTVVVAMPTPADFAELDRLAQHALDKARANDCAVVRTTVEVIRERDVYYALALVGREPLIRACMNGS